MLLRAVAARSKGRKPYLNKKGGNSMLFILFWVLLIALALVVARARFNA